MRLSPQGSIMATIKARRQANGSIRYTAVIRFRQGTAVLHQESKTFAHRSAALTCGELRPIARARKRSRRPTADELTRLRQHFDSRDRRARIPMRAIIGWAI
jgi:hypothetical protein